MPDIPDDVRRRAWLDNVRDYVARKAGELGSATVEKAQEVARGYAGNPGTPYGEAMNRLMAAGRSLVPGRGTYGEELQRVKEAREEEYPGAYSVVKPLRDKALSQSLADDMLGNGIGMASPIAVHASPVKWAGQPTRKMAGTGEGGAAYGEGLYASIPANAKGVDRRYRGQGVYEWVVPQEQARKAVADKLRAHAQKSYDEAFRRWGDSGAEGSFEMPSEFMSAMRQADFLENDYQGTLEPHDVVQMLQHYGGNADATSIVRPAERGSFHVWDVPDNLLDFEAPVKAQAPEVFEALSPVVAKRRAGDPSAPSIEQFKEMPGKKLYDLLGMGDDAQATNALHREGVPGHQYLGEAGSSGEAQGIPNFVIYDDQAVKPLGTFQSADEFLESDLYQQLKPRIEAEQRAMAQRYPHLREFFGIKEQSPNQ